jgi:hypothetical protein
MQVNSSIECQIQEGMGGGRIWGVPFGRTDQRDRFLHPLRPDEWTRVASNWEFQSAIEY